MWKLVIHERYSNMKKALFTLLVGGFCTLNAADSTDIEPGAKEGMEKKVAYQIGVPVVATWEHDLDAGTILPPIK